FDFTCQIQKPAISSFVSANGPSTTVLLSPENRTRAPFELGWSPSPASMMPAFTSSSLNCPISVSNFSLGRTPASVSWLAFRMIMNRIVVAPSGCGFGAGLPRRLSAGSARALSRRRTRAGEIDTADESFSPGAREPAMTGPSRERPSDRISRSRERGAPRKQPSGGPDREGVTEKVARIPAGLDPLQTGIVVLVVERVPGDAGGVPLRVGEIDVGMVDQGAVRDLAGHGHASRVGKHFPVEGAHPGHGASFLRNVSPTDRARGAEDRAPLRRGRRAGCHGVDPSAVGDEAQDP